jgi:hypothetical protein
MNMRAIWPSLNGKEAPGINAPTDVGYWGAGTNLTFRGESHWARTSPPVALS